MTDAQRAVPPAELLDAMPHIVWTHGPDGVPTYFNRKWVEYTGADVPATLARGVQTFVHADDLGEVMARAEEARAAGAPFAAVYRLRRADGVFRWHEARILPLVREGDSIRVWLGTAVDVDDMRRHADEQAFLVEASRLLGSSLDFAKTISDIGTMVVPRLADWFAIDLLGDDDRFERVTVAHVDPDKVALAWDLWTRRPPHPDDPNGVYSVVRTRRPQHLEEIPDELLASAISDPELLTVMRSLGLRSSVCVPIAVHDRALGALTLVAAESQRRYTARDVAFAEEFARRVAIAIDNARLYGAMEQARAAAEAIAAEVLEQSRAAEEALLTMRRERDEARAALLASSRARP